MICSFIPGRIRLRSPRFKDQETVETLLELLKDQPGVARVENNLNTGSLLVFYDPEKIDEEAALKALALLEPDDASCEDLLEEEMEEVADITVYHPALRRLNKDAVEYAGMLAAFIICTSSAFLRSKGLHVYSGLTLAGLTVQHIVKYRKRLLAMFR